MGKLGKDGKPPYPGEAGGEIEWNGTERMHARGSLHRPKFSFPL